MPPSRNHLSDLPPELLSKIAGHLDDDHDVARAAALSRGTRAPFADDLRGRDVPRVSHAVKALVRIGARMQKTYLGAGHPATSEDVVARIAGPTYGVHVRRVGVRTLVEVTGRHARLEVTHWDHLPRVSEQRVLLRNARGVFGTGPPVHLMRTGQVAATLTYYESPPGSERPGPAVTIHSYVDTTERAKPERHSAGEAMLRAPTLHTTVRRVLPGIPYAHHALDLGDAYIRFNTDG